MTRIRCCIPGCSRTMGADTAAKRFGHVPAEWICQPHWSRLSRKERAIWGRMKRQARRFGVWVRPEAASRVWAALKRRAGQ